MDYYDQLIYESIKASTESNPCDLVQILFHVDGRDKSILLYEQLKYGLQRLITNGKIREISPHKFIGSEREEESKAFSGLSIEEYQQACQDYRTYFEEIYGSIDSDDDELDYQKLIIKWKLPTRITTIEEELDKAEILIKEIENVLDPNEAGIFDFEESDEFIEIPIYGRDSNEVTDSIYSLIKDVFKKHPCPSGSYIIRIYNESGEGFVSDLIL